MMPISGGPGFIFHLQEGVSMNQAAPVQNTWYTAFDEAGPIRIYRMGVGVEDDDETLEVRFTVDGVVILPDDEAITHSVPWYVYFRSHSIAMDTFVRLNTVEFPAYWAFLIEGNDIKIEVRKTTAAGAGNLVAEVMWGKLGTIG